MEAPSKVFLLFFLLPDWLKFNHLKSRMECGFSDIFSRHICSSQKKQWALQTTLQVLARKNVQKTTFEAAEMILGPWNQQYLVSELKVIQIPTLVTFEILAWWFWRERSQGYKVTFDAKFWRPFPQ